MNYAYNNGMMEQPQQGQPGGPTFNGGGVPGQVNPMRNNLATNKTTRGLPAVLPDPGVMGMQPGNAMAMMMNSNPNNPYGQMNAAAPQQAQATTAAPASHFSFFGHHMGGGNNQQQQPHQQQQQSTGPSLIQKMMGGGGNAMPGAPSTATENPVEGLLSKGKDLIFKKFGLWVSLSLFCTSASPHNSAIMSVDDLASDFLKE